MNYESEYMGFPGGVPQGFDPRELMKNLTDEQLLEIVKSNPQLSKQYENIIKHQLSGSPKALTSSQYIKVASKIEPYLDPEGGIVIQPSAGFVLKTFELNSKQKVFINVVEHEIVDEPEQKMLVDYENQPGLRIPMSVGKVKQSHDNKGEICKVVDVVLNPRVIEATKKDQGLLLFLFEILQNYIFEKYQIKLDEKFKRLKELNYKGSSVECHRVKGKKAPKIEQVYHQEPKPASQQKKQEELFQSLSTPQSKPQTPKFTIYTSLDKKQIYDLESTNLSNILIEIQLPLLIHSKGILLEGNEEMIHLLVKGFYEIYLRLPTKGTDFQVRFIKNRRVLEIQFAQKQTEHPPKEPAERKTTAVTPISIQSDLLYDLV